MIFFEVFGYSSLYMCFLFCRPYWTCPLGRCNIVSIWFSSNKSKCKMGLIRGVENGGRFFLGDVECGTTNLVCSTFLDAIRWTSLRLFGV